LEADVPFTIDDLQDLIRLLQQHPEWRAEVRRLVLTDDLLALPEVVRELAAAQALTATRLEQLAAAQERTETRLNELVARVEQLATQVGELATTLHGVLESQKTMQEDIGYLKGWALESRFQQHAGAYFGRLVRRAHRLGDDELETLIEPALADGRLSRDDFDDIRAADIVVRGRRIDDGEEVYLVIEVSWGVGLSDVQRAVDRAALLGRAGVHAQPVVAGTWVTSDASQAAREQQVHQVTSRPDGMGRPIVT
jgi:hypothetical protein